VGQPPEAPRGKHSSTAPGGRVALPDFGIASRIVRKEISVVVATMFVVIYYSSHRKIIPHPSRFCFCFFKTIKGFSNSLKRWYSPKLKDIYYKIMIIGTCYLLMKRQTNK
jgi:hypothetical protein